MSGIVLDLQSTEMLLAMFMVGPEYNFNTSKLEGTLEVIKPNLLLLRWALEREKLKHD